MKKRFVFIISSTVILAADWSIAVGYWTVSHSQIEAPTLNVISHSQSEATTLNVISHSQSEAPFQC